MVDGVKCGPDGHRVDVAGNVWSGSTSVPGYMGVTVWNPAGKCIGRIRLPETCANRHLLRPQARLAVDVRLPVGLSGAAGHSGRGPGLTASRQPAESSVYGRAAEP